MLKKFIVFNVLFMNFFISAFSYNESYLDNIEYSKYGTSYTNEDLGSRLRRLESEYFGMAQSGDVDNRIQKIIKMAENEKLVSTTPFEDNYVPNVKKKTAIRRFFEDNLPYASYNQGIITGYTPPIMNNTGYNRYRNQYYDFIKNPNNNYCPYHNTHHNNHRNKYIHTPNIYSNNRYGYNRQYHYNQAYNRAYDYNPYYRPYQNPGITNVATRSTVHILQD